MTPQEFQEWMKKATLKELCDSVIWEQVMEGTAWCGWTEKARLDLVKQVQESVHWAIDQKLSALTDLQAELERIKEELVRTKKQLELTKEELGEYKLKHSHSEFTLKDCLEKSKPFKFLDELQATKRALDVAREGLDFYRRRCAYVTSTDIDKTKEEHYADLTAIEALKQIDEILESKNENNT